MQELEITSTKSRITKHVPFRFNNAYPERNVLDITITGGGNSFQEQCYVTDVMKKEKLQIVTVWFTLTISFCYGLYGFGHEAYLIFPDQNPEDSLGRRGKTLFPRMSKNMNIGRALTDAEINYLMKEKGITKD